MKELYELGYVASPLNAPTRKGITYNMTMARRYESVLNHLTGSRNRAIQGYVPALLDDHIPEEREMGLKMGLELLSKSDALILCGKRLSNGMEAELRAACESHKKIYILNGKPTGSKLINRFLCMFGVISISIATYQDVEDILQTKEVAV